jgi:hypothetical protein
VVEHVNPDGKETVADWRCAEGCPVAELDTQSGELKSGKLLPGHKRGDGSNVPYGGGGIIRGTYGGDSGGASRFYHQFSHDPTDPQADLPTFIYQAKASRSERERGCDGLPQKMAMRYSEKAQGPLPQQTPSVPTNQQNHHPTVKPLALMRHLCRLVTPAGGTVLDPFAGSGTTGCAAMLEGLSFLGAEREAEYVAIARARIGHYFAQSGGVASDGVAAQQKSNVAPQQNATKLRSLRSLPKRVT